MSNRNEFKVIFFQISVGNMKELNVFTHKTFNFYKMYVIDGCDTSFNEAQQLFIMGAQSCSKDAADGASALGIS